MATKIPSYEYTGTHSSELKNGYWYIYLKSNGTLKFAYDKQSVAACIVAGGGGGAKATGGDSGTAGGAGGEVKNLSGVSCAAGTPYSITVGSGGAAGASGKSSSAFSTTASGGAVGGGGAQNTKGSDGTYAFGDSSLPRYGADGGGGRSKQNTTAMAGGKDGGGAGATGGGPGYNGTNAKDGTAYTGAGGGGAGGYYYGDQNGAGGAPGAGGYGIVILRGTEDDFLPVFFNGTQLSEMYVNGAKVETFTYAGTKIF